jgi:glycosyltransferase 2 family protein
VSRSKILVGLAISVGLFVYLLGSVDRHQLLLELRAARWQWVLVGLALPVLGLHTRAKRWWYLFPPGSHPPGLVPAVMIGYMANNVLPLRAGEVVRVYVVARRWGHGFWTAVATLIVERVLDSITIVLLLAGLMLLIPVPPIFEWAAVVLLAVDVAGVGVLAFLALSPVRGRRLLAWLGGRWPAFEGRALRIYDTFVRGLDGVRQPAHLLPLCLWTVVVWFIPAFAAWIMLRAVGLELPFVAGWTILVFVGLGISLPSAPGYVGVFHLAARLALEVFGVPREPATAYAILFHATQIVPITVAGWLFLLREHMSLAEARRAAVAPTDVSA